MEDKDLRDYFEVSYSELEELNLKAQKDRLSDKSDAALKNKIHKVFNGTKKN